MLDYLLVDLHEFGDHSGVKLLHVSLELSQVLNDPLQDSLEPVSAILEREYSLQVEWALESTHEFSLTNHGWLFGVISTCTSCGGTA